MIHTLRLYLCLLRRDKHNYTFHPNNAKSTNYRSAVLSARELWVGIKLTSSICIDIQQDVYFSFSFSITLVMVWPFIMFPFINSITRYFWRSCSHQGPDHPVGVYVKHDVQPADCYYKINIGFRDFQSWVAFTRVIYWCKEDITTIIIFTSTLIMWLLWDLGNTVIKLYLM